MNTSVADAAREISRYSPGEITFMLGFLITSFVGGLVTLIAAVATAVSSIRNGGKLEKVAASSTKIEGCVNGQATNAAAKIEILQRECDALKAALADKRHDAAMLARTAEVGAGHAGVAAITAGAHMDAMRAEIAQMRDIIARQAAAMPAAVPVNVKNETSEPVPTTAQK